MSSVYTSTRPLGIDARISIMPRESAGLLLFRQHLPTTEVFLVHPGGPFWAKKDLGAWSIPKGEPQPDEPLLTAAQREFREETGFLPDPPPPRHRCHPATQEDLDPDHPFHNLGTVRQASGKRVTIFALEGNCDPTRLQSNLCTIEWPLRSGRHLTVPEVDRGAWFTLSEGAQRLTKGQRVFLDRLSALLATPAPVRQSCR